MSNTPSRFTPAKAKWKRFERNLRLAGIALLLIIIAMGALQLYQFYENKLGFSSEKAIETYFNALAQGDYAQVYQLTAKEHLTDIYGRPLTEGEFVAQLQKLTGDKKLPFRSVEAKKILDREGSRYYAVTLRSAVGGVAGASTLLVETHRQGTTWVVTYPFAILL